jgi:hypothetical protein
MTNKKETAMSNKPVMQNPEPVINESDEPLRGAMMLTVESKFVTTNTNPMENK